MKAKQELKNFVDHYGIKETLDALADILIESCKKSAWTIVRNFLDDMNHEFDLEGQR